LSSFDQERYELGACQLQKLSTQDAIFLAGQLSTIDPWKTLQTPVDAMARHFAEGQDGSVPMGIFVADNPVGIISIKLNWLLGPYLEFLGLIPAAQGQSLGETLLQWMEAEARKSKARNMFLCVSQFNVSAQRFYEQHGFKPVGMLEGLITDNHDEILMRKRLHQ